MADMAIAAKVKEIIKDKLSVDDADVKDEASFADDLGADSLDAVELIMEFEKEFEITIPDEQAEKIRTVGDAISYIENYNFDIVNYEERKIYNYVQPEKVESLNAMVESLGKDKEKFLNEIESSINSYISYQSWQDCLTIVERDSQGKIKSIWEPSDLLEGYVKRLIAFIRKKKYNGYDLDSKLTDGVVDIVTKKFEKFYTENSSELAKPLMQQLLKDKVFVNELANQIIDVQKGPLPTVVKNKMATYLVHSIEESMNINISQIAVNQIQALTTHIVSAAATVPISKTVAIVLLKNMAIFLKGAVAKVMATTAFKTMMATTIKKLVVVKIIASLLALLPALGGISIWWVLLPILAAFIAYEVANLPNNMGEKVSEAVRRELSGEFEKMNRTVVTQILNGLSAAALAGLVNEISSDDAFKELLKNYK